MTVIHQHLLPIPKIYKSVNNAHCALVSALSYTIQCKSMGSFAYANKHQINIFNKTYTSQPKTTQRTFIELHVWTRNTWDAYICISKSHICMQWIASQSYTVPSSHSAGFSWAGINKHPCLTYGSITMCCYTVPLVSANRFSNKAGEQQLQNDYSVEFLHWYSTQWNAIKNWTFAREVQIMSYQPKQEVIIRVDYCTFRFKLLFEIILITPHGLILQGCISQRRQLLYLILPVCSPGRLNEPLKCDLKDIC